VRNAGVSWAASWWEKWIVVIDGRVRATNCSGKAAGSGWAGSGCAAPAAARGHIGDRDRRTGPRPPPSPGLINRVAANGPSPGDP